MVPGRLQDWNLAHTIKQKIYGESNVWSTGQGEKDKNFDAGVGFDLNDISFGYG